MTEALKELFNAYKNLPIGVIFFKNQQLFFINEHLRAVLLLQNLRSDDVVQVIGNMVGLENASHESLCEFFSTTDIFLYRDRHLQINRQHFDTIDIFVIIRINDATIKIIDETHSLRQMRYESALNISTHFQEDEQQLLTQALGDWEKVKLPSIVLYKGIPIKSDCIIVHAHDGEIVVKVEKKQLSSAQIGTKWLIGSKRDKMLSGEVFRYDLAQSIVWLNTLKIVAKGFHLRQVIRYGASEEDQFCISIKGKKYLSSIHDISEKGLSIQTDNESFLLALSSLQGKTLDVELILSNKTIAVKAVWFYTIAVNSGKHMKVAFTIGYDLHNGVLLRDWLNDKQLQLIKEVRSFVQMIPPSQEINMAEWII